MRPPLTRDDPPSSTGSVFAATLALGESTDRLAHKVEGLRLQRKGLTLLVVITCCILIAQAIYGAIALQKITNVDTVAQLLTDEQVQRDQVARADFRTDRTIFCVNSFIASVENGTPYDSRCPSAYPGIPITDVPLSTTPPES